MSIRQVGRLAMAALVWVSSMAVHAGQWDGFFVGFHTGAVRSRAQYQTGPDDASWFESMGQTSAMWAHGNRFDNSSDPAFGVSLAYNRQAGAFVYGAELDADALKAGMDHTGTYRYVSVTPHYTYQQATKMEGLYTLRARAGYAFGNSLLSCTAGLAATRLTTGLNYWDDYPGTSAYFAEHTELKNKTGWTAGLGYQYMMPNGLVLKAEYAYIDLGRTSFSTPVSDGSGTYITEMNFSSKVRLNTYTLGIEKRF